MGRPRIRVVYPCHGVGRCGARLSSRLAAGSWLAPGHHPIRFSFSYDIDLGSGGGAVRRSAIYLRYRCIVADRIDHRGTVERGDGGVLDRTRTVVDPTATRLLDRNAGRDSKRDSRVVGNFRDDPVAACLSIPDSQEIVWVDAAFQRSDLWGEHAGRRHHHRHHDSANYHVGIARDFAERTEPAA